MPGTLPTPSIQLVTPILTITNTNIPQPLIRNTTLKVSNKYPQGLFMRNDKNIFLLLTL